MGDWTGRIIILLLLAVIIGVPLAMKPAGGDAKPKAAVATLVVITPHNEQIRFEIAQGFNRYRQRQGKSPVAFDWRSSGGTSDLRKQVVAEFEAEGRRAMKEGRAVGGVGYDLFFGGGDYEHNKLAGDIVITDERDPSKSLTYSCSVPVAFPPGMLEEVFPTPDIAGARLYHADRKWVGVVLASFGIVYNNDRLAALNMPAPATWSDLADARYLNEIALADPAHSGSIGEAYNAILMRLGWEEGWSVLRRVFANARYFASVSTKVSVDVSAGQAAAGMSIDFYGRFQASAVSGTTGQALNRLGYVDPPGMTKQNADPISILRGAPNQELANEFVLWLLSKESQRVWNRKLGTQDGPVKYELRRQPVRRDLYNAQEMMHWTDDIHPFDEAKPFPKGMPNFYGPIATIAHAMAIDVHDDLVHAWRMIAAMKDRDAAAAMAQQLDMMPEDLRIKGLPSGWIQIAGNPSHPQYGAVNKTLKDFVRGIEGRWEPLKIKWPADVEDRWQTILSNVNDPLHDKAVATLVAFFETEDPAWAEALRSRAMWQPTLGASKGSYAWRTEALDRSHPKHAAVIDELRRFVVNWRPGDNRLRDGLRWREFFRANYRDIAAKASGR
jgi:ABC-type Fe3+ transport system substrate-binding protein